MKQNKIKKSSNFAFWLGFTPIALFLLMVLFMVVVSINYKEKTVFVEDKPEVVHDTVFVGCHKKHCEDLVIPAPVKKKKVEEKRTDTVPTPLPENPENVEPIEE